MQKYKWSPALWDHLEKTGGRNNFGIVGTCSSCPPIIGCPGCGTDYQKVSGKRGGKPVTSIYHGNVIEIESMED